MGSTLRLLLTDELRAFVDENSGDGTLYTTPSEFVRDLLRRKNLQMDATRVGSGILEGYEDALEGRTSVYQGSLRTLLAKSKR